MPAARPRDPRTTLKGSARLAKREIFHGQRARNTSNGRRVPRWFSDFRESAKFLRMRGVKDLKPKKDPKGGITFTDDKGQ